MNPAPLDTMWQCHECEREVVRSLHPDNCPDCGHRKCPLCPDPHPPRALAGLMIDTTTGVRRIPNMNSPPLSSMWQWFQCGCDVVKCLNHNYCPQCAHEECPDCDDPHPGLSAVNPSIGMVRWDGLKRVREEILRGPPMWSA
jgi:hypothetical protein